MEFKRYRLRLKGKNLPRAHLTVDEAVERATSLAWLTDQEYEITRDGVPVAKVDAFGKTTKVETEEIF